ncbi:uncharacterized protein LOC119109761 [Pollicipes pollicipes]|uniref:uncharacterized protein LOC119109761 n=1 Tax=Pollicipes pollicipes TaxID=41117 RepID=UPI0018855523|nr:uncharacterized protein LOC119109761 [Pollicipes pollicipes]
MTELIDPARFADSFGEAPVALFSLDLSAIWQPSADRDLEQPDGADELYSRVQKRESTYEMMRECPEIIEEVVEMRYNTGTIVKPHLRRGPERVSAQELFDIPLDDAPDAKEAGSDSGVSSKTSENGDVYAVPRRKTRHAPQPPATGLYENPQAVTMSGVYENPAMQSINDNFVLMASQSFQTRQTSFKPPYGDRRDILNDSIEVDGASDEGSDYDDQDDIENDELEIDAAIDEALDAESLDGSVATANSDLFRAVPIEITSMDTLPKPEARREHADAAGDEPSGDESADCAAAQPPGQEEAEASEPTAAPPPDPPQTYITLNLKDHRAPRAGAPPPSAYRRAKMRKSSSMSDLLPSVFGSRGERAAPRLPPTMSLDTATRLEAAHRSLRDHARQTYMGFHRNHPWLPDLVSQPDLDYWVRRTKKGSNGFEELRKYIKHGGDFCKELASILQERSDLEVSYAKSLQKLSAKLLKASKEGLGSVNQAWQMVGAEMEYEADVHKTMAVTFTEELVKPLKGLIDTQHKVRKSVEGMVDKTAKNLAEWRSAEAKAKKMSYQCARENEKAEELALDVRLGRGKQLTEKETNKVQSRRQKTGNAMSKADSDYYTFCLRGERARLEWETAVNKGSQCFQALEEERLVRLRSALHAYHQNMRSLGPKMMQSADRLSEPLACADVTRDVQTVINVKGSGHNIPEQLLPDFYAEDMTNVMNRERRKKALEQFLHLIRQGVERERRGKHGVENLAKAIQETPHFGSEGSKKDVHEKLQHMRALLAYLEASRYKIQVALAELEGQPRPQHPLRKHIEYHKDRQGMTQSILKVPGWVALDPLDLSPDISPTWAADRGKADGTSHQPDSDFDEFSSQGDEREYQCAVSGAPAPAAASPPADSGSGTGSDQLTTSPSPVDGRAVPSIGRCKVLYDYTANMYDELTIKAGDTINVHDKQDDGWWLGELNGTVGIFPATYVLELT